MARLLSNSVWRIFGFKIVYDPDRLARILRAQKLDAIIACTQENVIYLSGFSPVIRTLNPYHGVCWVIVLAESPDEIHIVHSHGEADQILNATKPVGNVELYGTFYRETESEYSPHKEEMQLQNLANASPSDRTSFSAITTLIDSLGLANAKIALDQDGVSHALFAKLKNRIPACDFGDGSELLRLVRQVKTSDEIAKLTEAARAVERAIEAAADCARVGSTETEVAETFDQSLATQSARPALTMIKVGRHSVFGQRPPNRQTLLQEGDVLWFDCDATKDHYWADIARTYALEISRTGKEKFQALHAGQCEAIEKIRPGMTGHDVFELTLAAVRQAGFRSYRRHHVGHGIGLEPYEDPILAPGNQTIIEAGMILSVETPYYAYGTGALHVEDPILVGDEGNTRLTLYDGTMGAL